MQNKKVLMIGPDMDVQGGIASVIKLYKDHSLYENNIIYLASYKYKSRAKQIIFYINFLIKFLLLLADNNIKIVHIHTASRGSFLRKFFAFKIAKFLNKKIILHIHGAEFDIFYKESPTFVQKIIAKTLNESDLIIVLSKQWQNTISKLCSNENIKVLYNPTIIKDFEKTPKNNVNFLFMGRLGKRKGVYDIIEAARLTKNQNSKINLYGDGDLEEFQNLIKLNNLESKVEIKGWVSGNEKENILKTSDVLLLPSYNEGLPMSILEALAHSMPVISTPVGGIPEAVEDNINGFLIEPGDYKTLAEKIDTLATNPELRQNMGKSGLEKAKEKFDINIIKEQLRGIYDSLLRR